MVNKINVIDSESESYSWSFLILMALLMSFVALSIDVMLPALTPIGNELKVTNSNDVQKIITTIFLGMSFGLILFGPLSDSYGRKKSIYFGLIIFSIGCLVSAFSHSFDMMIVGRFIQGFGAASCRVITMSMIRDKYSGSVMAKMMSLIMIVFILVPALAPLLGQLVLFFAHWRSIFFLMFFLSFIGLFWLMFGQEETLDLEKRLDFSLSTILSGVRETLINPISRYYMIASGLMFGAFVGYLGSVQPILQVQYKLDNLFPVAFGALALVIGLSSFVNSRLVIRFGMRSLSKLALILIIIFAGVALPFFFYYNGHPPLIFFMGYLSFTFLCTGILFGNFNALAIEPLGHIAGVANSVISSLQTFISVICGGLISSLYDQTILPMTFGFLVLGLMSLMMVILVERKTS